MLEEVGADNLPSSLGGSLSACFPVRVQFYLSEDDAICQCLLITVPSLRSKSSFFLQYKVESGINVDPKYELLPENKFKEVIIPAGKNHVMDFNLKPGMQLVWNFKADVYDIGFQVELDGKQCIIPYGRVDAHKCLQKGMIECKTEGKCKFVANCCLFCP